MCTHGYVYFSNIHTDFSLFVSGDIYSGVESNFLFWDNDSHQLLQKCINQGQRKMYSFLEIANYDPNQHPTYLASLGCWEL